ncbi:E3 ubiquitin-protein ligase FANCL isoform X1 [Zerene cesonia]|uniref:E3 ubiquitin-protein ligase FANCL isoform X1 n=1 Tax=Zerene cesonia TaxID=33412 RepID=UPI0018E54C49|nr:E3 ubiquitin-protein ligase FANCL isoform X1 [Zerene cesonia]
MYKELFIHRLVQSKEPNTLPKLLEGLFEVFADFQGITTESVSSTLIDLTFLEEIRKLSGNINIAFGKTLRDIKCTVNDSDFRKHEIYLRYDSVKKLRIVSVDLPSSSLNKQTYNTIEDVITAFLKQISNLQSYFNELENIDHHCVVMEPIKPLYKDDYRNIRIDDKTWLHLEVTPDGSATNVHLIGQSEIWQDKLQKGLLTWDQDKNIVENIYTIFDIKNQSVSPTLIPVDAARKQSSEDTIGPTCGICYCAQLPDYPGLPQPLCQNMNCDVYFHKNCLFQWLVACEGGRPPAFGVINGSCPTCLQPISCSDKDC